MSLNFQSIFSLKGKTALVTGAGRGIGKAIALAYADAGAELILCARSENELKAVADRIAELGGTASVMAMDITDIALLEQKINALPKIDILCANAGTNVPKPILQTTVDDFDKVINLNLKATYFINLDSSMKCNTLIKKHLCWCFEPVTFSWPVI